MPKVNATTVASFAQTFGKELLAILEPDRNVATHSIHMPQQNQWHLAIQMTNAALAASFAQVVCKELLVCLMFRRTGNKITSLIHICMQPHLLRLLDQIMRQRPFLTRIARNGQHIV